MYRCFSLKISTILFLMIGGSAFLSLQVMAQSSPGSEIGDAVFRPIAWHIVQHTAIYRNSDSREITVNWDPSQNMFNSDMLHSVIQASGRRDSVGFKTFNEFLDGHIQLGEGCTANGVDLGMRKTIIATAKSQYGAGIKKGGKLIFIG